MPITMSRVDERLIHGQMALSWINAVSVDTVVVIDDASAHDEMATMLLEMAVSGRVECIVCDQQHAAEVISQHMDQDLFLCAKDPAVYLKLLQQGIKLPEVNIGGIYNAPGRKQLYKTVFLDDKTRQVILDIAKFEGTKVEYRMVPQEMEQDIVADIKAGK